MLFLYYIAARICSLRFEVIEWQLIEIDLFSTLLDVYRPETHRGSSKL